MAPEQQADTSRETCAQKFLGTIVMMVVVGFVGLAVAMVIAGFSDFFTTIAYGTWAFWGTAIGAVIGLIIFGLISCAEAKAEKCNDHEHSIDG